MVVEYGQGMTALRGQREMTFEIHLPQLVRGAALKPLERPGGRGRGAQPAMPAHDRRDGTQRRHLQHPRIAQHPPDLARTPSRMVLAHRHHRRLAWHRRTPRLMVAPPRPILQTRRTFAAVTRHPLICDRRTDLVAPAQLANVGSRLQAKAHKTPYADPPPSGPSRPWLPPRLFILAKCPPCARTGVHHVPGPNTRERVRVWVLIHSRNIRRIGAEGESAARVHCRFRCTLTRHAICWRKSRADLSRLAAADQVRSRGRGHFHAHKERGQ